MEVEIVTHHNTETARRRLGSVIAAFSVLVVSLTVSVISAAPAQAADPLPFLGTLAGPSQAAMYPSGEEYDAANDRLVIADTGLDRILFYSLTGTPLGGFGEYGTGNGQFASPRDVAVDETGNIYVADAENNRVQKFDEAGVFQWVVGGLGTGNATLNTPIGVTWDAANDVLLVASTGQSLIKAWNAAGVYQWKSPTGTALGARAMRDVSRGPDGRMWVTAYREHQIKVYDVSADGLTWNTTPAFVLGDGAASGNGVNQLNFPYNVSWSLDAQTVYVSDTGNGRIARWDLSGPTPVWLDPFGAHCDIHPQPCPDPPAAAGEFNHLRRVTVDSVGLIYGAEFWGSGIEVFNPAGDPVLSIEGDSAPAPGFSEAYSVDVAPSSGQVYVMDRLNHRIQRFTAAGAYLNNVGARGTQPATFSWPEALTVAPNGRVWAVDTRGDRIENFPADLSTTPTVQSFGSTGSGVDQLNYPEAADVAPNGVVWVADTRNDRLQKYDPAANTWSSVGSLGSAPGQFDKPMGVAVTATSVYVADTANNRIQKLATDGTPLASFSTGLNGPEGLEVATDGTVWVADTQNNRLVHLSADLVDLGDGFGSLGTGDHQFFDPHDVGIGNDKLYVADTYNNRVQMYDLPGDVTPPAPFNPTYDKQISAADGHAPVYPAGVAVSDDGTWYVADSGGSRIVTIDPTSGAITPVAETGLTDPRDLDINLADPTSLWVVDTGGNRLVKMSRAGAQLSTITGLTQPYGLANNVDRVYVANTYGNNVRAYNQSNNALAWTQTTCNGVAFSRPRDVGVADNGTVVVADTDNDRIVVLNSSTGACVSTFGTRGTNAGQFKSPRSVTSDGSGGLWVADALNYRVQHLSLTGASLGATPIAYGEGPTQFRSPHCVTKIPSTSRVAVCDTYNFRVSVYDGAGASPSLVQTVGGTKPANGGFNGPFGLAYGPTGELYVADWFNHRIQKFNADGSYDRQWGGYGPQNGSLIFPRNVLVDGNGDVVVTDSENNRIDVFSPSGTYLRQIKPATANPLNRPHQVALDGSGGYWVANTNTTTSNLQVVHLNSAGLVIGNFALTGAALGKPQGIAVDTDGSLLVSNTVNNKVERYTAAGALVGTVLGTTQVNKPAGLLVTGTGATKRVYVTDFGNNRVVVLDSTGAIIKTFGATGSGAGQFTQPRGVAVDPTDGDIAVADFGNDRVSLWKPTGPSGPVDSAAPTVSVTDPAAGSTQPFATVNVSGTASDDLSVATVEVAAQRSSDNLWLQGNGTWGAGQFYGSALLAAPGATTSGWTYAVPVSASGGYTLSVRVTDGAAKTGTANRSFTVAAADTTAPNGLVSSPTPNQTLTTTSVDLAGTATDNVAVSAVRIAVKNRVTGLWLQADGTWTTTASAFRLADLANPGAASTAWSLTLALPVGDYGFSAKAVDTAGLMDATVPWNQFQMRSGDTVAANGTLTSPTANQTIPQGPITLTGQATDDVALGTVKVGIQNATTKQWLKADGTFQTAYTTVNATLASPGATSSSWSFVFTPPVTGRFGISVIAADANGNIDPTKPWVLFNVS